MKTKKIILGTLLALGVFVSCDKAKEALLDEAATQITAADLMTEANIDSSIDDISNLVQDQYAVQAITPTGKSAAAAVPVVPTILPTCATTSWSINTVTNTLTRTIDFGTTGCALNNGNVVKGKIIMTFLKDFDFKDGAVKTVNYSLEKFYHNGNLVTGNKLLTITKKTTSLLNVAHTVVSHAIDTQIAFADGKIYKRSGTLIRELTKGEDTPLILNDNEFTVTGETKTTLPSGTTITNTIKTPLILKASCEKPYPLQGTVTTTKGSNEAIFDFGNGDCDNMATITIKGVSVIFELKRP